ncbi:phage virion morphogenesis protein [Moraxella sp. FZLJ2107]|uniref:phage virion morphogenesis protein n=1 Tax=unclassified Moraxella TaxID=2685852 RepID=UPI0020C8E8C3|nr:MULTISPECIES: phage virion morphogenesis protein [unclassified Moraxella]UTO04765.1 phage virion morphogenesis protein [Moraxella sp. FZLJ2107]UTO21493.1 phage virion morphogenesis protein [Moraxella sp. FZLJ2109]
MKTSLDYLPEHLQRILAGLDEKQLARAKRKIATKLRTEQRKRITRQENVDGSPYEPRRPRKPLREDVYNKKGLRNKKGRVKKMFAKIKQAKHMRITYPKNSISIGYVGLVGYVANIHQFGLTTPVGERKIPVKYPVRELLGISESDKEIVDDALFEYLDKLLDG